MSALSYRLPQARRLLTPLPGPRSIALAARRSAAVSLGVASSLPVYVAEADGGVIVDVDGNALVDLGSGIAVTSVGASNPAVVAAVSDQVARFTHTCFMIGPYESYVAVAEELNALAPGAHEKRTALFNSGAEAVENAIKIARYATGRSAVVAFEHAYHGRTNLALAVTSKAMPYKSGFGPFAPEVYRVPTSYPFREGLNADGSPMTGVEAAERAIGLIETQIGASRVAALLIEPIHGEGGFIVPAAGFLPELARWAGANGVVFIADEIQTGLCRTGAWLASEHEGLVPDLVTTAKALAGGLPLSAVTGRAELLDGVHPGGLGGTYGGNPVACAAAVATLEQMRALDLSGRAREIGAAIRRRLTALATELDFIGEVRGRGAMMAIELVEPGGRLPNPAAARAVVASALRAGVVVLSCGAYGNVIRLLPPLVISDELLEDGLSVLEDALREAAAVA
ncbi:MAG: 4-aminobutyrate--2-oxoglutarate transaminase [Labilithrix sp.]|nr:4-aminobutyrate--2-oxoglutarate transaminase [Labilithrix sp.]MBX3216258.1 4-aminobutyrate--2-oxoglutarate transaminase [Labilithrix sp.]